MRWFALALLLATGAAHADRVVVYTSVDQVFAEPILETFEAETGIRVDAVFDAEAVKTVGLATRLAAEAGRPRADVFWNNEILQTIGLARRGLLAVHDSPQARDLPARLRDPEHRWAGYACRARVLLVNRVLPRAEWPRRVADLAAPRWAPGCIGIASPLFGSTSTHAAALAAYAGRPRSRALWRSLRARARVVDGNALVRDLVVSGHLLAGLTDTDDALAARGDVEMVVPDQGPADPGAVLIPHTVALVHGAPHPDAGRALVDYLLSRRVEARLVALGGAQIPARPDVPLPAGMPDLRGIKVMPIRYADAADAFPATMADVRDDFLR